MANRRELQKQATREQLYERAMQLFDARGYEEVNIDDIVTACRVARGTFYFHFPKKEDLLLELIRRAERHTVDKMKAVSSEQPLLDVLTAIADAFAEVYGERRALLPHVGAVAIRRIAAVAGERDEDPLRLELVKHVDRAVTKGELNSPLPSQMIADVFLLDGFAGLMSWAASGEPELPIVMQGIIALFLNGVSISES